MHFINSVFKDVQFVTSLFDSSYFNNIFWQSVERDKIGFLELVIEKFTFSDLIFSKNCVVSIRTAPSESITFMNNLKSFHEVLNKIKS